MSELSPPSNWQQMEFPLMPSAAGSHASLLVLPAEAGRAGVDDDRFLWPEMLRLVAEVRPTWVLGENVTHLDGLALEQVASDLEAIGYEVGTFEIPACAVGHDHWRARLWICGHANRDSQPGRAINAEASRLPKHRPVPSHTRAPHGIPSRLDGHRRRALGNSVTPQIPELIGRAILHSMREAA